MIAAEKPAYETERLRALRSYALLDTAAEMNFDSIVQLAARLTGASASMIWLEQDQSPLRDTSLVWWSKLR